MSFDLLDNIIDSFNSLQGITKKQAQKITYNLIDNNVAQAKLSKALSSISKIKKCNLCHGFAINDICDICSDKSRGKLLVIVESSFDVFKFEDLNIDFNPYYYVLGDLIKVSSKKPIMNAVDFIDFDHFKNRVKEFKEVVLALSSNLDGIVTANYIKTLLVDIPKVKITQLAQGIPLGAAIEYVDGITLKTALKNRKVLD